MDGVDACLLPIQYSAESIGDLAEDGDIGPVPDQIVARSLGDDEELDFEA
jgi:hypothetical protein